MKNMSVDWDFGLGQEWTEGNVEICRGRKRQTNRCLSEQEHPQLGGRAD